MVPLIRAHCTVPIQMRVFRLHFVVSTIFQVIKLLINLWPGTQIKIVGVNTGESSPTWQCFIDNISFSINPPDSSDSNNRVICEEDTLVDGPHNLIIDATVLNNQTFWIDNIQYVPSASVPLDQAAIVVDHQDPQLQFSQGWSEGDFSQVTPVAGAMASYNFIGM